MKRSNYQETDMPDLDAPRSSLTSADLLFTVPLATAPAQPEGRVKPAERDYTWTPDDSETIKVVDCYFRFHTLKWMKQRLEPLGTEEIIQTPIQARVTQLTWNHTPDDVFQTITDYSNKYGKNVPLWLSGRAAFKYAGLLKGVKYLQKRVTLQHGLNSPDTVVSIILPSGVAKLQKVMATRAQQDEYKSQVGDDNYNAAVIELNQLDESTMDIFGIRNTTANLAPDDYLYTTSGLFREAIKRCVDAAEKDGRGSIALVREDKPGLGYTDAVFDDNTGAPYRFILPNLELL